MSDKLFEYYRSCCESQQIHCPDIIEHLPTLRDLAAECKHVTEFGFRYGASFSALLMGEPHRAVTYDIYLPPEIVDFFYSLNLTTELQFNKCSTLECVIQPTDLLFIDTLHTYDQLRKELRIHGNKSRKYLIFHDTQTYGTVGEDKTTPGLLGAIMGFMADNPHWHVHKMYYNNNGLTVLKRRHYEER